MLGVVRFAPIRFDKPWIGLHWLLRLRWLAVLGQLGTCLVVWFWLQVALPMEVLSLCLGVTLLSNAAVVAWLRGRPTGAASLITCLLLLLDTLTLTVMLYWTGGIANPFGTFYLLHLTIAAILLPPLQTGLIVAWCALCQAVLFLSPHPLIAPTAGGTWVATLLTAVFIALFVGLLSRALAAAREAAERSARFESVATMAAGIAHELATPLGTIAVVSADWEKMDPAHFSHAEAREDGQLIRAEVERCRAILEKLGTQATQRIGDVATVVAWQDLPALLAPYLKPPHAARVRWTFADGAGELQVPEAPLLQSIAVLVKNACEASREDQAVEIVVARTGDSRTRIAVQDQGQGMPPEVAARVGEPFFTTKEPGVGMGLGLFLVRTFIERVHGKLEVESAVGQGSTMTLVIPSAARA